VIIVSEPTTIVKDVSGQIDMTATLLKQDKAIKWLVSKLATKKAEQPAPPVKDPIQEIIDTKVKQEAQASKKFLFVYKHPGTGAITTGYIDMALPVCPACKAELGTCEIEGSETESGRNGVPRYVCPSCGTISQWSVKNTKWWED
jgi:hypothetical protein